MSAGVAVSDAVRARRWFKGQVQRNLHVVFTINPDSKDFHNRTATSPALFNRCVLDWFGDWPDSALFQVRRPTSDRALQCLTRWGVGQVANELTARLDLDDPAYRLPFPFPSGLVPLADDATQRHAIAATCA
jgi:dynein heavy chain 1